MERSGKHNEAILLVHGGAGPMDPSSEWVHQATEILIRIVKNAL